MLNRERYASLESKTAKYYKGESLLMLLSSVLALMFGGTSDRGWDMILHV